MAKDLLKPERIKKTLDKFIGHVVNVEDEENLLRVQTRVYGPHSGISDDDLPWCEYGAPPGNRYDNGTFIHVEPGDYVWVDFPYDGDVRRPRLLGSVHYCPDGEPNFPHEAWLGPDAVEHKRILWEPPPAGREYFLNNVFSQFGLVVEIVQDSIIVTQKKTGTAIEITPDGDITLHSEKNIFMTAQEHIKRWAKLGIEITSLGSISVMAPEISVIAAETLTLAGGGTSIVMGDEGGECDGDFHFTGDITGDKTIIDGEGNTNHHTH